MLDAFKLKNLTPQEVKDAKNYIVGNFLLRNEDNKERADCNAEWSLLNKQPNDFLKKIGKVTITDIQQTAKKYFHQNYTEVRIQQ